MKHLKSNGFSKIPLLNNFKNPLMFALLLLIMVTSGRVFGQTGIAPTDIPPSGFGIEGDGQSNSPVDGVADWWNTEPGSTSTNHILIGVDQDNVILNPDYDDHAYHYNDPWGGEDPSIFTGSTKVNDPYDETFTFGPGQVPNKNEINRATVHFSFDDDVPHTGEHGDLWCVFSADRQVNNGEAYIDFEFLQAPLTMVYYPTPGTGGYFSSAGLDGTRTEGDILVTIMFTNGGNVPTPVIQRWENPGNGWTYVTKPLSFYQGSVLMTSNQSSITPPWMPYGLTSYATNQFAEGAINLSELMNFSSTSCGHISTVFVRTKTSQSATAELKDFPGAPYQVNIGTNQIIVDCPDPVSLASCTSDVNIQAAYSSWRNGFTYTGGVPPITENIGDLPVNVDLSAIRCGGTINFTYSVEDDCGPAQTCSSSFTVGTAPDLVANCPGNVSLTACTQASDIVAAYNTWKAGFSVSGGCSPTSNLNTLAANPPTNYACGFSYTFTLNATNATGYCVDNASCSSTFTVAAAPDLVVNCPGNVNLSACTLAADIVTAYNTWKAGFSVSGGCSPTSNLNTLAPDLPTNYACGFSYTFTLNATNGTGLCADNATCSSTFTVAAAPDLVANCPGNVNLPACTSSSTIITAYNTWKAGFSLSGGCSPTSNITNIAAAPPTNYACGFSYTFTLNATNGTGYCADNASCSSTFTVAPAPDLIANCPGNVNLPACTSASTIITAYNTWKAGFSVSGGCSPTSNLSSIAADPPANFACGFSYTFTLNATNGTGYCADNASCSSTFTVAAASDLIANCPGNVNLPACTPSADIVAAYNTWKAGFSVSGGCSPTSNIATIAAAPPTNYACGFSYTFTLNATNGTGYCADNASCSSTFTVAVAPDLIANCPGNVNLPACTPSADIVAAYNTWKAGFSVSGGCSPTSNIATIAAAPPTNYACGFSYTFTLNATNGTGLCADNASCSSTFTVAAAPDLIANCPGNVILPACTSASVILTAYNTWKAGFSVSGGCSPTSNIATIAAAPPTNYACGFSYTFTLNATNGTGYCADNASCSSTFTVAVAPDLIANCPGNVNLPACTLATDIVAAYNTWKAGFSVSGGCSPTSNIATIAAAPPTNYACGFSYTFTLNATNGTGYCADNASCSSTFTVAAAPDLIANCPGNVNLPACTPSADIVAAYNTWKAGFSVSGGCSPTSNIATIAAAPPTNYACGFSYTFTLNATNGTGYCADNSSCSSTFTVAAAPDLIANCPGNVNLPACTPSADIVAAYNTWKAGFSVSGGCSPTSNIATIAAAPPTNYACGFSYTFTLNATNGTGYCADNASCSSTFTVAAAPDLIANCPGNINLPACTSASAILTAYNTWKAGFSVSGGCSPTSNIATIAAAPPTNYACGFSYTFTLNATNGTGYCADNASCSSTFTVAAASDLIATCPGNVNLPACTSAADIVAAYNTWKAGFSVSGGCSPTSNITTIAAAPPTNYACGFSYTFTLNATNGTGLCADNASCSSTFTVAAAPDLIANCPGNVNLPACTSASAILTAYNTWKAGFSVSGGCSPTSNIATIAAAPPTNYACGFSYTFTLNATNGTGYCADNASCSSTFTVAAAPDLIANCPGNVNLPACTPSADIVAAYNTWKAGFSVSGGCSPTSNIATIAAAPPTNYACGFSYTFTLNATNGTGLCADNASCSSTFTVAAAPDLIANCPGNVNLPACTSASVILTAYNTWKAGFSVSGGCSPTSNITTIAAAPPTNYACGFSYTFTLNATNGTGYCADNASCSSTFTVAAAPDLIANCPGNVNLPACTSASAILTAYNTWKAGFSVSGGCSPTSNIATIAAALPTNYACGFSYTFTLNATNGTGYCADNATCSSTFTVAEPTTVTINKPDNFTESTCDYINQSAVDAAFATWLEDFSASGGCSPGGDYGSPQAPDHCDGGTTTVVYNVTDICFTGSQTATFTINPDLTDPVFTSCPSSPIDLGMNPGTLPNSYMALEDAGIATDDCSVSYEAIGGIITGDCNKSQTWTVTATDYCGNQTTCEVTYTWSIPCELFCSLTQGFYGNAGGTYCGGTPGYDLMTTLLSTELVLGYGSNTVTVPIAPGGVQCVIDKLPGSGSSFVLSGTYSLCNIPSGWLKNDGSLKNSLLAQTITLGLNMRLDNQLYLLEFTSPYFVTIDASGCDDPTSYPVYGTEQYYTMPASVMAAFGGSPTVQQIYDLANQALGGGSNMGCSLGDINAAVGNINSGLDQCRFIYFTSPPVASPTPGNNSNTTFNTSTLMQGVEEATLTVIPNPFQQSTEIRYNLSTDSRISLEVYNLYGTKVATLFEGEAKAGFDYTYRFDPVGNNSEQVFLVVLRTNFGTVTKRIINTY